MRFYSSGLFDAVKPPGLVTTVVTRVDEDRSIGIRGPFGKINAPRGDTTAKVDPRDIDPISTASPIYMSWRKRTYFHKEGSTVSLTIVHILNAAFVEQSKGSRS